MASWHERFRVEGGVPHVDLRVRRIEQLFDHRDPAPFFERDLDDDAAEYLIASVEELPNRQPFALTVWVAEPLPPDITADTIVDSIARHFDHAHAQAKRRMKKRLQRARWMLAVGVVALVAVIAATNAARGAPDSLGYILSEGLTILAWVMLWRPLEILLFDWPPYLDEKRCLARIRAAPLSIRQAASPPSPSPAP